MTNLFDALEFCLREIESGGDLETALARFPEYARELRPILKTAIKARSMASAEPSAEAVRRSRSRVMQRAAEMRESKIAPRRRIIPVFQRWALAFALAAVFLMSGNGLLSASASALPGERLYPVKRGWESIRLFFIFDSEARELLEYEFENERLHEVNELLAEGRHEVIEFAGVFMQVNGVSYVSGLQVILPPEIQAPANGSAVIVSGQTNAQGFIEIISLEILPEGSDVPAGFPIEVESESETESETETGSNSGEESVPEPDPGSGSGDEAEEPEVSQIDGALESISTDVLVVNGVVIYLGNAKVEGQLCIGVIVEAKGHFAEDGRFIASEVKGLGDCASSAPPAPPSGGSGGQPDNSNGDDSNEDESSDGGSNDDNSNDDDSNNDDSNNDNGNDNNDNDDDDDDDNDNNDNDND